MQGANAGFDFADWSWCLGNDVDFIQAIQLPGLSLSSSHTQAPANTPICMLALLWGS